MTAVGFLPPIRTLVVQAKLLSLSWHCPPFLQKHATLPARNSHFVRPERLPTVDERFPSVVHFQIGSHHSLKNNTKANLNS